MSLLSSVGQIFGGDLGEPVVAKVMPFEDDGLGPSKELIFQYFPETISDTKSAEYASNTMPGGSHPIRSWIAGGDRLLSFAAVFTRDKNPEENTDIGSILSGGFELTLTGDTKHTVDIEKRLNIARSYLLPRYTQGVAHAPLLAQVLLPNSGIISGGILNVKNSFIGVMLQCDIVYEAFHRNGAMRHVVVNMSFAESVQTGEEWGYTDRDEYLNALEANTPKNGLSIPSLSF